MNKIQMTEEQAINFIHNMFFAVTLHTEKTGSNVSPMSEIINQMKQKGYIKKSELEIAKKEYEKWKTSDRWQHTEAADYYIEELEKALEKRK
jgi:GTP cyclohydrolase FolE2